MLTVKSEQVLMVDVDFTLLLWGKIAKGEECVQFTDPYTKAQLYVKPHRAHVKILKDRLERGATVFVWSAAGWKWARAALRALNIDHKRLVVMSKPIAYIDDKPCQEWMGERIYLDNGSTYAITGLTAKGA